MSANQSAGRGIVVILLILLCLTSLGSVWALSTIPRQVEQRFGPPAPSLGRIERISYGGQLLLYEKDLLEPGSVDSSPVEFQIQPGESASMVALRLEELGFIRSAEAFRVYLVYAGLDTGLQAGSYQINPSQSAVQIARTLQDATPGEVLFIILPGWRIEEVAAALSYSGLNISQETFLGIIYNPAETTLPEEWRSYVSLEGFMLPGTYKVSRDISAQELVLIILDAFNAEVNNDMRSQYEARGLSLRDAVILASIVQREAVLEREQPMIASVFFNRLNAGMKLDSDPTVQYAVGYNAEQKTWWTNPLSRADLAVNSAYNTYQNIGLPPGPISNPGISALQAVAYPADTPYFYFQARCDQSGEHNFAITYDQHLQNSCP